MFMEMLPANSLYCYTLVFFLLYRCIRKKTPHFHMSYEHLPLVDEKVKLCVDFIEILNFKHIMSSATSILFSFIETNALIIRI